MKRKKVQNLQVVANFFTQLYSFSRELKPVTEKKNCATLAVVSKTGLSS